MDFIVQLPEINGKSQVLVVVLVDLEDSSLGPMPRVKILSSKAVSWDWLVAKEKSFVA